jgi:hypothetical protein
MNQADHYCAEVIEATLTHFIAQSWAWDHFCPFGSVIVVDNKETAIFGIVYHIQTGSADTSRQPFAYQKTYEELQNEQPQIFTFLKTTFSAIPIAFSNSGHFTYALAQSPCTIHAFVRKATHAELILLFKNTEYLHHLFAVQMHIFNIDELLLALLFYQQSAHLLSDCLLKQFFSTYSLLINNDYRRIKLFSSRVQSRLKI